MRARSWLVAAALLAGACRNPRSPAVASASDGGRGAPADAGVSDDDGGGDAGELPLVVRWTRRQTQLPTQVWENNIAYDPIAHRVVQHGGHVIGGYPQSSYTFTYDLATDTGHRSTAPFRPQRRCLVDLVYVDSLGRVLTGNGGSSHGSLPQGQPAADRRSIIKGDPRGPWLYDTAHDTWEDARTRGAQWNRIPHNQLAYDPAHDAVLYLAGTQLALYSPRANVMASRALPPALQNRHSYGIVALGRSGQVLVFGGVRPDGAAEDDTWLYDVGADAWQELGGDVRPPRGMPRADFLKLDLTYDPELGRALLFTVPTDTPPARFADWPDAALWSFDPARRAWSPVAAEGERPHYPGLMTWGDGLLVLVGGGRDGPPAGNPRPALSRELWTGRIDVPPPARAPAYDPDTVALETGAAGQTTLSWAAADGKSYEIWRAPAAPFAGVYARVATTSGGQWTDADAAGKPFAYRVVRAGLPLSAGSLPAFNQPLRPHGLTASVESASRVVLRWSANAEPDLVGYDVYRAAGTAAATRLTSAPVAATSFVDDAAGLGDGLLRTYFITAVNRAGLVSGASPLAYSMPDAPLQFAVTVDAARKSATVRWQWPAELAVSGFQVYVNDHHENTLDYDAAQLDAWWAEWKPVTAGVITAHEVTVPLPDPTKHYYFYARAVNVLGQPGFYTDIASGSDPRFDSAAP